MMHISQKLVNIIHLVAVSVVRAQWRTLVMQHKQSPPPVNVDLLGVYIYSSAKRLTESMHYQLL